MKLQSGIALLFALASAAAAQSLAGLWDASIQFDDTRIRFPIEFSADGSKATLFNGDERITSTSGQIDGGTVTFRFDHYATQLVVTLRDGKLSGTYGGKRSGVHQVEAAPHRAEPAASLAAPEIGGVWSVPTESAKGEHAWRLVVKQNGAEASAAILRVDGDTGALTGRYDDGKFVLHHFDGTRPAILEITPQTDGSLALSLKTPRQPAKRLTAVKQGAPAPTDPAEHTRWQNPEEPFTFRFPDLYGKLVSNTDPRFQGKVVIVSITGSWCPNCHDEAPFLVELYRKYRALGLEIVALDFEEADQLASLARARAFVKKYGIEYAYLVAGEPGELQSKIPQAENLNSWPTTFFLDRDGKVRAIHAGFPGSASGEFHTRLKREVSESVERLLAAPNINSSSAAPRVRR
jgi:thiol-disulfide isomerase/thioredoxin